MLSVAVVMAVLLGLNGAERKPDVTMKAVLVMLMRQHAMAVSDRVMHRAMMPSAPTECPDGGGSTADGCSPTDGIRKHERSARWRIGPIRRIVAGASRRLPPSLVEHVHRA